MMRAATSNPMRRRAAIVATAAALTLSCTERSLVAPTVPPAPSSTDEVVSPDDLLPLGSVTCRVEVKTRAVTCGEPAAGPAVAAAGDDIIYGGQHDLVELTSANVDYDAGTGIFRFDVQLRNLIAQRIGTLDGSSAAGSGIRVFFEQEPRTTEGTGVVTLVNTDGAAAFTATEQPFYSWVDVLNQYEQTIAREWLFDVPPSVISFDFGVYVSAPVQFQHGWIDVSHPTWTLSRTRTRLLTGTVRNQYGQVIAGAEIAWSSAVPTTAEVSAGGLVTGRLPGVVEIRASSQNNVPGRDAAVQPGVARFTIVGTTLVWTGAVSTDWDDDANWDRGVSPLIVDTVTVPGSMPHAPILTSNASAASLVADQTTIGMGAFDLVVNGSVRAPSVRQTENAITSTTGRLILTGATGTVSGRVPRLRVHGRYQNTDLVETTAPLRVEGNRLRIEANRVRVTAH